MPRTTSLQVPAVPGTRRPGTRPYGASRTSGRSTARAGAPPIVAIAVLALFVWLFTAGPLHGGTAGAQGTDCVPAGASTTSVAGYGPAQMTNASTIVAVGKTMGVPEQGWVDAIAAAMQESDLVNVDHGDRDSLGLFQERPSQGWGSPQQVLDPTYAATKFYQHLLNIRDWQALSVNDAAQAVERSGFPNAYGPHEQAAREVVGAVQGSTCH